MKNRNNNYSTKQKTTAYKFKSKRKKFNSSETKNDPRCKNNPLHLVRNLLLCYRIFNNLSLMKLALTRFHRYAVTIFILFLSVINYVYY